MIQIQIQMCPSSFTEFKESPLCRGAFLIATSKTAEKLYLQWDPSEEEYDEDFWDNDVCIPLQPWALLTCPWSKISFTASPHGDRIESFQPLSKTLQIGALVSIPSKSKGNPVHMDYVSLGTNAVFFLCFGVFVQKWPEEINPISAPRGWLRRGDHSLVTWHLRRHEGEWFILFLSFTPSVYIPIYHCHTFTYTISLAILSYLATFLCLHQKPLLNFFHRWDCEQKAVQA